MEAWQLGLLLFGHYFPLAILVFIFLLLLIDAVDSILRRARRKRKGVKP